MERKRRLSGGPAASAGCPASPSINSCPPHDWQQIGVTDSGVSAVCRNCSKRSDPQTKRRRGAHAAHQEVGAQSEAENGGAEEAQPPPRPFQANDAAVAPAVAAAGSAAAAAAAAGASSLWSPRPLPLLSATGLLTPACVAGGPLSEEAIFALNPMRPHAAGLRRESVLQTLAQLEAEGRVARLSDGRRAVVAPGETMEGRGSKRETAQLKIIHTGTRDQFVVEVPPADPIASLKVAIERRAGIPAGRQRLVFGGRELLDGRSVASYGLQGGATLNLVVLDSRYVRGASFPLLCLE
jgi:ubiquitin-like protein Nedd8